MECFTGDFDLDPSLDFIFICLDCLLILGHLGQFASVHPAWKVSILFIVLNFSCLQVGVFGCNI